METATTQPQPASTAPVVSAEQARQRLADLRKNFSTAEFLASAENGDVLAVPLFLQSGMNIETRGKEGDTALMRAAGEGRIETVRLLLENKADVNAKSNTGLTALIVATSGHHLTTVKYLCEHGANVNDKSRTGVTALYAAASENEPEIVSYLLSTGSNPLLTDILGNTPLLAAVQHEKYTVLAPFLKNLTVLNSTNIAGFAAIDFVREQVKSGNSEAEQAAAQLKDAGAIMLTHQYFLARKDALARGVELAAITHARRISEGKSEIHAERLNELVATFVSEFETNAFPVTKVSLMYLAAAEAVGKARFTFSLSGSSFPSDGEKDAKEVLNDAQRTILGKYELSLKAALAQPGFDPNMTDDKGITPLLVIAQTGNVELAKALMEKGANPNFQDAKGETPLRAAEQAGKPEMIGVLRAAKQHK
jgi:ankyrin repeat protein